MTDTVNKYKRIAGMLLALCLVICLSSCNGSQIKNAMLLDDNTASDYTDVDSVMSGFTEYASNERFQLLIDEATTNISVIDGASNRTYTAFAEGSFSTSDQEQDASSLLKVYYDNVQNEEYVLKSGPDSVEKGQYAINRIDNGAKIDFTLGQGQNGYAIPMAITVKRMNELVLDKVEDDFMKSKITTHYMEISEETAPSEEAFEEYVSKYPLVKEQPLYILLNEDIVEREIAELEEVFSGVGYTREMAKQDNAATGQDSATSTLPRVKISLEITLSDTGIRVSVPAESVKYNQPFELTGFTLMEYFGAVSHGEDGYILFPDGSGAIYNFGNDETQSLSGEIIRKTYGPNYAVTQDPQLNIEQEVRLPVFGLKSENGAMLAIIEKGDAIAELRAQVSTSGDFNRAYPTFALRTKETFEFGDIAGAGFEYTRYERFGYSGEISVSYNFTNQEQASLGGMAGIYREYLSSQGALSDKVTSDDIPFYLETMGTFLHDDSVLGIPVTKKSALTTFDEAQTMLSEFSEKGIKNLQLKYTGFANGGMKNRAYNRIDVESKLGGKNGLKSLIEFGKNNDIGIYPDVELTFVAQNGMFDGFSPGSSVIRDLNEKYGGYQRLKMSDALSDKTLFLYALIPSKISEYSEKLNSGMNKIGFTGVSAASLGSVLTADFNKKSGINRQDAQKYVSDAFKVLSENRSLMISGGNAYAMEYASHILNMPDTSSRYGGTGQTVPFLQMVLHGYKQYAGTPVNLSGDDETALLNAAMTGGGLYYLLNYNNTEHLAESVYANYYSTKYDDFKAKSIENYKKLNGALREVASEEMTGFEWINQDVSKTTYANGKSVYVNFGSEESEEIPARDFLVK